MSQQQQTNSLQTHSQNNQMTTSPESDNQEEVLRSDILIPYLLLVQDLSDFKKEGKANVGDICKSTTAEKYGDAKTPVDVVFLHYPQANWILEEKPAGATRFKFRRMFPRNAANENLPWSFWGDTDGNEVPPGTRGASEWRRVKQLAVFAILKKDIEAAALEKKKLESGDLPDPTKALTPVMVSFRGSSYDAGKEVCSFFTQTKASGVDIFRYALPLTCEHVKDQDTSYHVYKVNRNGFKGVEKENLETIQTWVSMVTKNRRQLNVHEEAEGASPEKPVAAATAPAPSIRNYAPPS